MKKSHLLGGLAVLSVLGYMHYRKKENDKTEGLSGINFSINPQTVASSAIDMINMNPLQKEIAKSVTNNFLEGLLNANRD